MSPRGYRRLFQLFDARGDARSAEEELDLELESHVAMRAQDLERAGWPPDAALAEARRRFGDFEAARRTLRAGARRRGSSLRLRERAGALRADLRFALRQIARAPGFATLAIASLAVGIGATTTIFTLVEHVLLRPLPYAQPERLVALSGLDSTRNPSRNISAADWHDWQRARSLEGIALHSFPYRQGLVVADSATRASAVRATGNFFAVLRPHFVAGRGFTEEEAQSGAEVVVIGERLWRHSLGADPTLGSPLRTPTRSYRVVGVVAGGRELPDGVDVWFAAAPAHLADPARVNINWTAIGRLRAGSTLDGAAAELTTIARAILANDPGALYDHGVIVEPLRTRIIGDADRYLALLMAVVGCVLLIVCANVAAAGLARAAARSREMAVRASIGAGRGRLVQQLLVENAMLGVAGGAIGLALAWGAVRAIIARWGDQIPRAPEVALDTRVWAFAFALSIAAGLAAGLIPALRLSRAPLHQVLGASGRGTARGGRGLVGATLVGSEIALAMLLLTGSALLVRSFRSVLAREIGFDTNVATVEALLSGPRFARDSLRREAYWDALAESYRRIPGVEAVGLANWVPLGLTGSGFIEVAGRDVPGAGAVYRTVNEEFFRTLRMPLLSGRTIDRRDVANAPRVAVINQAMAAEYWPGENPVGQLVKASSMEANRPGGADWLTIVGVVGDVRTYGLEAPPQPEMYVSFRQTPSWTTGMTALVRGRTEAAKLLPELRRRAATVDPAVAVDVGTLDELLRDTLSTRSLTMTLLTAFAGIALLLAAIGVYGVLSYAVVQRTRELAVRSALGARRGQLLALVFGAGMRVVLVGLAAGLLGATWLSRFLESMLVEVRPLDPVAFLAAAAVLLLVALAAILVPARRATRLAPAIALQAE